MRTQYKLSPAYNLPDTSQWFIECNKRDMQPYRCDTALRADFWEAFNCAVQEALDHNETSITIIWEYRPIPTNRRAYRQKAHSGSTKYAPGYVKSGLRTLYGYPDKLTSRETYKTAWHLARLLAYQRKHIGKAKAWEIYRNAYKAFGISDSLAYITRFQLWERDLLARFGVPR